MQHKSLLTLHGCYLAPSVFIFLIIRLTQTPNGHITCTLRRAVPWKGNIFH